jgi:hypothetical protein
MYLLSRQPKVCRYILSISYQFCTHRQIGAFPHFGWNAAHAISKSGLAASHTCGSASPISCQAEFQWVLEAFCCTPVALSYLAALKDYCIFHSLCHSNMFPLHFDIYLNQSLSRLEY